MAQSYATQTISCSQSSHTLSSLVGRKRNHFETRLNLLVELPWATSAFRPSLYYNLFNQQLLALQIANINNTLRTIRTVWLRPAGPLNLLSPSLFAQQPLQPEYPILELCNYLSPIKYSNRRIYSVCTHRIHSISGYPFLIPLLLWVILLFMYLL